MFLFSDPPGGFTLCFIIGLHYYIPIFAIMLPIFIRKNKTKQSAIN